ncbi:MAG: tRNA lysidine(34) synthetase TilS [Clostridia bacterium]|nr:tRNA lysidine(34) synthetase TilS [Clostridia bacterium]
MMEAQVIQYITDYKMINAGDRIGVAVSGGEDSMALLNILHDLAEKVHFEIVAIHINHNIRHAANSDARFVKQYCEERGIDFVKYSVDVPEYSAANKISLETAARILRYECFENALKKQKLNKIAIAHHMNDQAETVLMHLFRGCALDGASGMQPVSGVYIRPFLETKKSDIIAYNYRNNIPHVVDDTNEDNSFRRNYIRNMIMPLITKEWRSAPENLASFAKIAARDSKYIADQCDMNGIVKDGNVVRIPLNRFYLPDAIVTRMIYHGLSLLDLRADVELKHVNAIIALSADGLNGEKVSLPHNAYAVKEYEYISLVRRENRPEYKEYSFKVGKTLVEGFGTITVTKTISYKLAIQRGLCVVDAHKLPKKAKWRFRLDGDMFEKIGGGSKKLNSYFTDKKIPARLRPTTPVLALDHEVYCVGGVAISEKVKTDLDTIDAYVLEFTRQ